MTDSFYITPSRISGALQCGLRYYRQYVAKLPGDKPSIVMFAGDMQHRALEAWGTSQKVSLRGAHEAAWLDQAPASLSSRMKQWFSMAPEIEGVERKLDLLAERILADRPDIKDPRRTKEFRDQAETVSGGVGKRYAKLIGQIDDWFRSEQSPWRPTGPGPIQHFEDGTAALGRFLAWWDSLGDGQPDVVYTEAKQRDVLFGGPQGDRFTLTGVVDQIWLWPDGSIEVIDFKRSAGREDDIAHFVQASAYELTCRELIGQRPDRVVFHHLKEGQRLVYPVQDSWPDRLTELAERVKKMHAENEFPPSFRTCSWCDYRRLCHDNFEFDAEVQTALIEEAA